MYKNYLQVNKISCNTIQYNNFTSREKSNRVRIYKNTYNMQKLKKNIRYTKKQKKIKFLYVTITIIKKRIMDIF